MPRTDEQFSNPAPAAKEIAEAEEALKRFLPGPEAFEPHIFTLFLVMGAYLVSLAPLTWLIMSEIFPNRLRGKAMGVASVCVWTASYVTAIYFPPMVDWFKTTFGTPAMAFWIYAGVSAAAFLFSLIVVPETKGRTLEELGASWNKTPQTH